MAGPAARRPAERPAHRPAALRLLGHVREVLAEAIGGRHQLRRALRQRERRERLLRPVTEGLRPGGGALPALRRPDPARGLHEPVLLQLPALPAPALGAASGDTRSRFGVAPVGCAARLPGGAPEVPETPFPMIGAAVPPTADAPGSGRTQGRSPMSAPRPLPSVSRRDTAPTSGRGNPDMGRRPVTVRRGPVERRASVAGHRAVDGVRRGVLRGWQRRRPERGRPTRTRRSARPGGPSRSSTVATSPRAGRRERADHRPLAGALDRTAAKAAAARRRDRLRRSAGVASGRRRRCRRGTAPRCCCRSPCPATRTPRRTGSSRCWTPPPPCRRPPGAAGRAGRRRLDRQGARRHARQGLPAGRAAQPPGHAGDPADRVRRADRGRHAGAAGAVRGGRRDRPLRAGLAPGAGRATPRPASSC